MEKLCEWKRYLAFFDREREGERNLNYTNKFPLNPYFRTDKQNVAKHDIRISQISE